MMNLEEWALGGNDKMKGDMIAKVEAPRGAAVGYVRRVEGIVDENGVVGAAPFPSWISAVL